MRAQERQAHSLIYTGMPGKQHDPEGLTRPGYIRRRKFIMKKFFSTFAAVAAAAALVGCSSSGSASQTTAAQTEAQTTAAETTAAQAETTQEQTSAEAAKELEKLVVGASPAPHAEILEAARDILKEKGFDLEIVEYTDYVQPNNALEAGDLDANYFQHKPYLDSFNAENGTHIVSAGVIHYEPFGIYAGKTSSLEDLADGAEVLVPNDVTNEARALLLLQDIGLLKLKDGVGLEATINDITENPKNLKFIELEAAQLPRSLQDADVAVINGNYAIEAGLKVTDALATESSESLAAQTYGNIVAVREGDEETAKTKALVEALSSETVKAFIEGEYEGAVVPMF